VAESGRRGDRGPPPAILLRESFRDGDKVRTRTLANLTSWAPERIEALRRALKGEFDGLTGDLQPVCGPIFAVLFVLKQLAERVGLLRVLGTERWAKLVLFLLLARVATQGSRLSAVRWAAHHAVAETLGLGRFDEDDLYEALDRLAKLALLLVLVCVAAQGSRLSAVRWAAHHAVAETLGLGHFDEEDL